MFHVEHIYKTLKHKRNKKKHKKNYIFIFKFTQWFKKCIFYYRIIVFYDI